jgi:hypothetical protein
VTEPGQELAGAVGLRREAVEAEAVDQQVREAAIRCLAGDVAVELGIDDLDFVPGQRSGIATGGAQAVVIEQELAPDVGCDDGEILPAGADPPGEAALVGPD